MSELIKSRFIILLQVIQKLRKATEFDAWKKNDIPEKFHIKNHARTPPVLVLAKKGFFIEPVKFGEY